MVLGKTFPTSTREHIGNTFLTLANNTTTLPSNFVANSGHHVGVATGQHEG